MANTRKNKKQYTTSRLFRKNNISVIRQKRGISRIELAYVLHTGAKQLYEYETGTRPINSDRLIHIARFLQCSIDELLDYRYVRPPNPYPPKRERLTPIERYIKEQTKLLENKKTYSDKVPEPIPVSSSVEFSPIQGSSDIHNPG